MKKIVVAIALAMVLAFSAVSFAASLTLGGRVTMDLINAGDGSGITASNQFRLNGVWNVNDATNARVYFKSQDDPKGIPTGLYYAEINTKLMGGTARFGRVEYGFSPLNNPNKVSNLGAFDGGAYGAAFLSPTMNGLTVNAFAGPVANGTAAYGDTWNLGAEAKMDIAGGNVGLALAKMGDADSQWSVFGSYPVVKDTMTVYGEYGKTAAEADVKNIGIKGTISGLNYILEDDLASEMGYAEIGKPVNGVTYKAMYYFGDGLSATNDGKVQLEARVDF